MPAFVHITSEDAAKKARRSGGLRALKRHSYRAPGVFAMPVTVDFQFTHQWLRELKRWRHGLMVGVYFRLSDSDPVLVGRYNQEHQEMSAAESVALATTEPLAGFEVIIPRSIESKEITAVRKLPQVVGWRYYPGSNGQRPCPCRYCQRGQYGSRRLRDRDPG